MAEAYAKAAGRVGLANARQVMCVARQLVIERTGGDCWKDSASFTQVYLPDYQAEHPSETADWDVVYDDRGHLPEPHTRRRDGMGTLAVRDYIRRWADPGAGEREPGFAAPPGWPTRGPDDRYRTVLYIEKEGFLPILERARLQERFNVALMSTKGMTVTAARRLIEALTVRGCTIFALHDFDKSGLGILNTMRASNRRYTYGTDTNVVDLGLRLADLSRFGGLPSERVEYRRARKDPRVILGEYGASRDEQDYLVRRQLDAATWEGERVELNAMTADQFVAFIESKFAAYGVGKVVPDAATLAAAYRRQFRRAHVQAAADRGTVPRSNRAGTTRPRSGDRKDCAAGRPNAHDSVGAI